MKSPNVVCWKPAILLFSGYMMTSRTLKVFQTNVMRLRAWLTCHTFSSSYSSKASWNWAGVKPRETQRCSASAIRTTPPAPLRPATPSVASSRTREKITSDGRCVLERKSCLYYTLGGEKDNLLV